MFLNRSVQVKVNPSHKKALMQDLISGDVRVTPLLIYEDDHQQRQNQDNSRMGASE